MLRMEHVKSIQMALVCEVLKIPYDTNYHQTCPMPNHADVGAPSCKYYENNSFTCFGCKAGGSTIDLVMGVLGLKFPAAIEWLEVKILKQHNVQAKQDALRTKLSSMRDRVANSQQKREATQLDVVRFRSSLTSLVTREGEGIRQRTHGPLPIDLEKALDGCYSLVDEVYLDATEDVCQFYLAAVKASLRGLQEVVDDFQGIFGSDEGDT